MDKLELRKQISGKINSLSEEYINEASSRIMQYVMETDDYWQAENIFCYVAVNKEVQTRAFIQKAINDGKRIGVPLCTSKGVMEVREITSLNQLIMGKYNIPEPKFDTAVMKPEDIDLAIVPCVTGNYRGERLGHGGGFYDRYLGNSVINSIMVCLDKIIVENVPIDDHDIVMDVVITEKGVFK